MRRNLKFVFIAVACLTISLSSCSSPETATNSQPNVNRASNASPQTFINNNGQPALANSEELANANVETAAMRKEKRLEEMRAAANSDPRKAAPVNTRPAPEDSEMTTTLTDVAREVRIWKKHPTLAKVEKIYDGKNVTVKVYLRDGRVIDLPGSSIAQLDQIPAATVLGLAGLGSTTQANAPGKTASRTKKANN